jgi:hypothetical protein
MYWFAALILLFQLTIPVLHPTLPVSSRITGQEQTDSSGQETERLEIIDQGTAYHFGELITFQARIQGSATQMSEMIVFITPEGQPTVWEEMEIDEDGTAVQQVDARRLSLPPFSKVHYRFEARLNDGSALSSDSFSFDYADNRFDWQSQESGIFQVYWYGNDLTLGQEILNIAERGLQKAQNILMTEPPQPLRIYAYTSSRDLQSALQLTSQSWIAGHASPQLGMILISVPAGPEKKLELERQIPHEIAHLLQYQLIGNSFLQQPIWLTEGMASLAELYSNPEYRRVLEATTSPEDVIPFGELCTSFPREANGAFRAYAQSESFVRYLHEKFGAEKLHQLINQYQDGFACEEGFTAVYTVSLAQMEYRWKQEVLGIDTGKLAMENLSPYLLLGLLVIIPASLAFVPFRSRPQKNRQ